VSAFAAFVHRIAGKPVLRAAIAALGVVSMAALWWPARAKVVTGFNDFVMVYAGAHLVGSPDLYRADRMVRVEAETTGAAGPSLQFTRPPYWAVLWWPLCRLPFGWAYAVWQCLALAALVAFIWLWPSAHPWAVVLACCWSVPLSASFANGQDCTLLLLWIALVLRFHQTRPYLAGLALSLCAAKFQLFLLVPLLVLPRRQWTLAAGLLTGGGVLLLVSFLAGGPAWPQDYYRLLTTHTIPGGAIMPNLHGMLQGRAHGLALEWLLSASVVLAAGMIIRFSGFEEALAATLVGGLLISYHAYPADAVVLIPALLLIAFHAGSFPIRLLASMLLLPFWYVFLMLDRAQGDILRLGLLLLVYMMAWSGLRTTRAICYKC
jgi:hypothetical protein